MFVKELLPLTHITEARGIKNESLHLMTGITFSLVVTRFVSNFLTKVLMKG